MPTLNQTWTNDPTRDLPLALTNGTLHVNPAGNRLWYVAGTSNAATTGINEVYTAKINGDGSLGAWRVAGVLPKLMAFHSSVMHNDWLYVLNGTVNAPLTPFYAVKMGPEGDFTGAVRDLGSIDSGLSTPSMVMVGNWLYVIGGNDGSGVTRVRSVRISDGGVIGNWQTLTDTPLVTANFMSGAIFYENYLYIAGGTPDTAANATANVIAAKVEPNGKLGSWNVVGVLPAAVSRHALLQWRDKMLLLGGQDTASANTATIYSAALMPNGQLGAVVTETAAALPAAQRNVRAVTDNKRIFVVGGFTTVRLAEVRVLRLE